MIRWFEFSRFNPLTLCFILIIFIDYLYIKRAKLVQLAKDDDCNVQDLGSNPRSILFPILFCKLCSPVILVLRRTICLPHPKSHASKGCRSRAQNWWTHYALVNAPYGTWESQRISSLLGLNYWIHTSMLGQKTPLVCFSIHFFYFIFNNDFIFFIC